MDMTTVDTSGSTAATAGQTAAAMNAVGPNARAPERDASDLRKEEWTDA